MLNRKLSRGVSKIQAGAMMAMAVLGVTSLAPRAFATTFTVDNVTGKSLATDSFAYTNHSGLPGTTDTVAFDKTLTSQFAWILGGPTVGDPSGSANSWLGVQILNPGGNI